MPPPYDFERDASLDYLLGPFDADRMIRLEGIDPYVEGLIRAGCIAVQRSHPSSLRNVKYITTTLDDLDRFATAGRAETRVSIRFTEELVEWKRKGDAPAGVDLDQTHVWTTLVAYHEHAHQLLDESLESYGVLDEVAAALSRHLPGYNEQNHESYTADDFVALGGRPKWTQNLNELASDAFAIQKGCLWTSPFLQEVGEIFDRYFSAEVVREQGYSQFEMDELRYHLDLATDLKADLQSVTEGSGGPHLDLDPLELDIRFALRLQRGAESSLEYGYWPLGRTDILRVSQQEDLAPMLSGDQLDLAESAIGRMRASLRAELMYDTSCVIAGRDPASGETIKPADCMRVLGRATRAMQVFPSVLTLDDKLRIHAITKDECELARAVLRGNEEARRQILGTAEGVETEVARVSRLREEIPLTKPHNQDQPWLPAVFRPGSRGAARARKALAASELADALKGAGAEDLQVQELREFLEPLITDQEKCIARELTQGSDLSPEQGEHLRSFTAAVGDGSNSFGLEQYNHLLVSSELARWQGRTPATELLVDEADQLPFDAMRRRFLADQRSASMTLAPPSSDRVVGHEGLGL